MEKVLKEEEEIESRSSKLKREGLSGMGYVNKNDPVQVVTRKARG